MVLVATIRALKMHGGVARDALGAENVAAVREGVANLKRHIENIQGFGVPVVVALNHFNADTAGRGRCGHRSLRRLRRRGGGLHPLGAREAPARWRSRKRWSPRPETPNEGFRFLYPDEMPLWDKIETIARNIYKAGTVGAPDRIRRQIEGYQDDGYGALPVCMAKTPLSFSADPSLRGAPEGHDLHVREVRLANGAGFLVAICGDIMTMPGLPRVPAANNITVNDRGEIEGLF